MPKFSIGSLSTIAHKQMTPLMEVLSRARISSFSSLPLILNFGSTSTQPVLANKNNVDQTVLIHEERPIEMANSERDGGKLRVLSEPSASLRIRLDPQRVVHTQLTTEQTKDLLDYLWDQAPLLR